MLCLVVVIGLGTALVTRAAAAVVAVVAAVDPGLASCVAVSTRRSQWIAWQAEDGCAETRAGLEQENAL